MHPVALLAGAGDTARNAAQNPTAPSPTARGADAAAGAVAQQVGPGAGGVALAVGEGNQLLAAVGAHPDDDQQAQLVLLQAHADVHPVAHTYTYHAG